ncbi:MAG: arginine decarboxylase, pyruvoyl-dependent [Armatimonadota bacterium]|nr:arginine decarboxylase, pyruvoyl-dependent [Armatimonadota bacterium]MCX7778009.1 arginine decarboxylase, pyruvoyl-dependent [Armatimonadota bacterium]MDW8026016.1 arginine decarboxylase, pyruvoyl-dependent [Armatimonadota bacterium]
MSLPGLEPIRAIYLVSGAAEGCTPLNAFDNALIKAGIGDLNLVKVSSIVPRGVRLIEGKPNIPKGMIVPCVYTAKVGSVPGMRLAVALGVAVAEDGFGVIMEADGEDGKELKSQIGVMLEEAFEVRGLKINNLRIVLSEHRVCNIGCTVAAAVFWRE